MKPREWWILTNRQGIEEYASVEKPMQSDAHWNPVHVIDKLAYDALLAQADKLAALAQACYDDFNCGGDEILKSSLEAWQAFKEKL